MRHQRFEASLTEYAMGAVVLFLLLMAAAVVVVLLAAAVALVVVGAAAAWIAWRMLPFRKWLPAKEPVDRLTDHYVAGHIDITEFERRLARLVKRV